MPTIAEELARVTLFSGLNGRQLRKLAQQVKEREFRPGVTIVEEGTMSGVGFFILADGEAAVSVDGVEVTRLGPGDHFGELALLSEDVRTASVTAVTRVRCLVIAFWDFRRFAKENPDVSLEAAAAPRHAPHGRARPSRTRVGADGLTTRDCAARRERRASLLS